MWSYPPLGGRLGTVFIRKMSSGPTSHSGQMSSSVVRRSLLILLICVRKFGSYLPIFNVFSHTWTVVYLPNFLNHVGNAWGFRIVLPGVVLVAKSGNANWSLCLCKICVSEHLA